MPLETWIVTGGAASGKSEFCRLLQSLSPSVALFSSDQAVHDLYRRSEIVDQIAQMMGLDDLRTDEGFLNRERLREHVLANPEAKAQLEAFIHPKVVDERAAFQQKLELEGKTQLLIAEVPLFYETKSQFPADQVILVAVSPETQRQRLVHQRGLSHETVDLLLQAQWPLSRKLEHADKVVWNEGDVALLNLQAIQLFQSLVSARDAK